MRVTSILTVAAIALCVSAASAQELDLRSSIRMPKVTVSYSEPLPFDVAITLNDNLANLSGKPPYNASVLRVGKTGEVRVVATHSSPTPFLAFDYRRVRGAMMYSLGRAMGNLYNNMVVADIAPKNVPFFVPTHIREMGAHEPVAETQRGNVFMFYLPRQYEDGVQLMEFGLKEYNTTGQLLWEWTSERVMPIRPEWIRNGFQDYLHANSVFEWQNYFVVSMRNSSQVLFIDRDTKQIAHRIGYQGDWKFINDPHGGFRWQHHARIDKNGVLSLYDNGGTYDQPWTRDESRAVRYQLNFIDWTATLIESVPLYGPVKQRTRQGSVEFRADGYTVVGWGVAEPSACDGVSEMPVVYSVFKERRVVAELRAECGWYTYRANAIED